ncbi:UbiA prenyltransferase family-domain-containing protein [Mycena pura]|uniref:4-hydroxybenzoate polyprenyltransferase, mitochondrial n=1 Tax=Mycena pura TaxID=153505 RepID=A0AAD6UQC1_9AGAR|nr:UbiA prenyltransferase family-domain-containing protein [Mycena pura]
MDHYSAAENLKETTLLLTHHVAPKPNPTFPLGLVPAPWRPYLELIRIEKPTGTMLMFWPGAWSLTMAAYAARAPPAAYACALGKTLVGAFVLRSAACTVNDIVDREVDAGVERTRTRPLPSGRVSVRAAALYLLVQYALGTAFFYATTRGGAFWVALAQLVPMRVFAVYPLLKRVTHWPQAWLGLAMNGGLVTAWLELAPDADYVVLGTALASCWCWTMLYDTIYACQDLADDARLGVRSSALRLGARVRSALLACGGAFVLLLAGAGAANAHGAPFFVGAVGGAAAHLVWQAKTVDLAVPRSCGETFRRNAQLGGIVWAGLVLDYARALRAGT